MFRISERPRPSRVINGMEHLETRVERLIRTALEDGEFDDLPGAGRPLRGLDRPYDPAWWARAWIERQQRLDHAHATAREVDTSLGVLWLLPDETAVSDAVDRLNQRLAEANADLPEGDRVELLRLDEVTATWRKMSAARRVRR